MKQTILYNKLVRDKIPEIIEKSGATCEFYKLENEEDYKANLYAKLYEEVNELETILEDKNEDGIIEEIADIFTVLFTIIQVYEIDMGVVLNQLRVKYALKGGFHDGIFLESVTKEVKE